MTLRTAILVALLVRFTLKRWPTDTYITDCTFHSCSTGIELPIRSVKR